MKRFSILAIVAMFLLITVLPAAAITNGEPDGEGHPNVGLMIADIDGEPQWRCTGTLIAPRVFLTAGHCVGDGATGARVWFDTDMTDNEEYPYGGETSIEGIPVPHPDYEWGLSDPHDVGEERDTLRPQERAPERAAGEERDQDPGTDRFSDAQLGEKTAQQEYVKDEEKRRH